MLETQKSLYDLGIFAKVDAAIQNQTGVTDHKYVLYDIEEANRFHVSAGLGAEVGRLGGTASTLDTPVGGTGFSPRVSMDLTRLNFLGRGHMVSLRGRVSNLEQRGSFNYIAPRYGNVEGRNITFTALWEATRNVRTFSARRQEASLQISQQFTKATTGLFRVTYRRVATTDVVIPALLVPGLLQPVRLGLVSANFIQDRRDNPTDARRGRFSTAEFSLASNVFGSQRNFLRSLLRNSTYHPINRYWTFARETTFGTIFPFSTPPGLERVEAVPLPERFFGGGNASHRGFPENQAGPRDLGIPAGEGAFATQPTGFPLGGNAVFFNSLELRFPLLGENISGVLFHDAGNVFRSIGNISFRQRQRDLEDFNYMVHAVGFGVRYKTPVGPVRIDLAYSLNPPSFVGFRGTVRELLECNPNVPLDQLPAQCRGSQQNVGRFQFFFSIGQRF
jgi:outer membrane protein insertion porin family